MALKRALATLLLTLTTVSAWAQQPVAQASGAILSASCPGTGCVTLTVNGYASVGIQASGTFAATLGFTGTADGTNYASLLCTPAGGGSTVSTTTSTGLWMCPAAGLRAVRAVATAYTSGSAAVALQGAQPGPAYASVSASLTSTTCPGSGCASLNTSSYATLAIQLSGTWTGTANFEATVNGTDYQSLSCTPSSGSTAVTTATDNDLWFCTVTGARNVRVRLSGSPTGTLRVAAQSATGGGASSGGGGSGAYLPLAGGTMTGALLFTDNTYDIGASGATRPRTGYFGTSIVLGTSGVLVGGTNAVDQRNGTNAQTFNIYNTYTNSSNGEWFSLGWASNTAIFKMTKNGTGIARDMAFQVPATASIYYDADTHQYRTAGFGNIAKFTSAGLTMQDKDIITGTTTGTKFGTATSQKLGFWNATPIVQPTTAVAAATFVANTSLIANDTATFDGYTIGQVVKSLRNVGLLQ